MQIAFDEAGKPQPFKNSLHKGNSQLKCICLRSLRRLVQVLAMLQAPKYPFFSVPFLVRHQRPIFLNIRRRRNAEMITLCFQKHTLGLDDLMIARLGPNIDKLGVVAYLTPFPAATSRSLTT